MKILSDTIYNILNNSYMVLLNHATRLISGILLILIGIIIASLLRDIVIIIFKFFRIGKWLEDLGVVKEKELVIWPNLLSELVRWAIIFIFLNSSVEIWGVPKVGEVLNQLLMFLPNVFVAVIVGLIGLVVARFAFDIVRHSISRLGDRESFILASFAKYAITFFTILIVLTQLGVAADLVRILFTGIVGMLALAFGLSFGLGGQEEAKNILKGLKLMIKEKSVKRKKRK